jgi:hypothetical protein
MNAVVGDKCARVCALLVIIVCVCVCVCVLFLMCS